MRVRPGQGSRPRTRRRPAHEDAADAFVAAVDRGRYTCVVEGREAAGQEVTAMKARELGRRSVVVGDTVSLVGDSPATRARWPGSSGSQPRRSVLRRSADDTDPVERVIVANADQLVIVTALADPPPRPRLIDRFLVAAYDAGLEPLLCLTKADLASPDEILAAYAPLGVRYLVTGRPLTEAALDELRALLAGRVSVLVGHSGVGKSTLVNALIPDAGPGGRHGQRGDRARPAHLVVGGGAAAARRRLDHRHAGPAQLRARAHRRRTTWSRPSPTWPRASAGCPPGCTHLSADCALDDWVAEHDASGALAARLDSLRRLLRSREGTDDT